MLKAAIGKDKLESQIQAELKESMKEENLKIEYYDPEK